MSGKKLTWSQTYSKTGSPYNGLTPAEILHAASGGGKKGVDWLIWMLTNGGYETSGFQVDVEMTVRLTPGSAHSEDEPVAYTQTFSPQGLKRWTEDRFLDKKGRQRQAPPEQQANGEASVPAAQQSGNQGQTSEAAGTANAQPGGSAKANEPAAAQTETAPGVAATPGNGESALDTKQVVEAIETTNETNHAIVEALSKVVDSGKSHQEQLKTLADNQHASNNTNEEIAKHLKFGFSKTKESLEKYIENVTSSIPEQHQEVFKDKIDSSNLANDHSMLEHAFLFKSTDVYCNKYCKIIENLYAFCVELPLALRCENIKSIAQKYPENLIKSNKISLKDKNGNIMKDDSGKTVYMKDGKDRYVHDDATLKRIKIHLNNNEDYEEILSMLHEKSVAPPFFVKCMATTLLLLPGTIFDYDRYDKSSDQLHETSRFISKQVSKREKSQFIPKYESQFISNLVYAYRHADCHAGIRPQAELPPEHEEWFYFRSRAILDNMLAHFQERAHYFYS